MSVINNRYTFRFQILLIEERRDINDNFLGLHCTGVSMAVIRVLLRKIHSNISMHSWRTKINTGQVNNTPPLTYNTIAVVEKKGYPIESHSVTTEDGYILTLHRIKHGRNVNDSHELSKRPPVILQHGLWSSSADWVVSDPANSLGYLLADEGFDVWLGNSRGNVYSRKHKFVSPEKQSNIYWDFSWHEMGYYDLPAVIDYVLKEVHEDQLYYVGHSQGTTIFFVMASTRTNYNNKIKAMVGLAPVAYLSNIRSSLLKGLARVSDPLLTLSHLTGHHKILPESWILRMAGDLSKNKPEIIEKMANNILNNMCTYACDEVQKNLLEIAVAHISTGASLKQLAHYAQVCKQDFCFCQFDYGVTQNMEAYGQRTPPEYKLKNITAPVCLYYSDHDWLVHPQDVEALYSQLPNKLGLNKVLLPKFNHLDFLWSMQSRALIFKRVISLFKEMVS